MIDYFLRFAAEQEVVSALDIEGWVGPDGKIIMANDKVAIDVIGAVRKLTGDVKTENGFEYPVTEEVPGYHVNIRMVNDTLPASLQPFCVQPTSPSRIFG